MIKQLFFLLPILLILIIPFWIDPDATGTYNTICKKSDSEIPGITQAILKLLPCHLIVWKIFHLLLVLLILWIFSKEYSLSIIGVVGFFLTFLLTLEDDLLAFPLLLIYGIWVLAIQKNNLMGFRFDKQLDSQYKLVLLIGLILFLIIGLFVWKGGFLIMLILLSYLIHPPLSSIPSVAYIIYSGLDTWGNSSEKIIGSGFIIGQIGLFLLLFLLYQKKDFSWKKEYFLLIAIEILVFFQPKWGEWLIIPLAFLLEPYFDKSRLLQFFGLWMYFLTIIFLIFTSFPTNNDIILIKNVVTEQNNGKTVLVDWGVGHYFEYFNGIPSQKGGFHGYQDLNNNYYLGGKMLNCSTIMVSDSLFYQKC